MNFVCCFPDPLSPLQISGGNVGFDKKVWEIVEHKKGETPSITFKCHSHDGEECYPGDITVTSTYTLTSSTTLRLDMEEVPKDKPTIVNLAQHTYWNLAGHNSGNILDHSIHLWANHITPVDENTVPTGEIMLVKGTPFDFTSFNRIGSTISQVGLGYDDNYVLDCGEEKEGLRHTAKVRDPSSSRVLNLWTNAPGVQFYTTNYVNGVQGKGGAIYGKHVGLCLEIQEFIQFEDEDMSQVGKSQLYTYLEEANVSNKYHPNIDVLQYWKDNKARFPDL
ncbi:galactose mutarotase-like [Glycine max]|uniref:galactose mutarotase-like n=1 Tax=Glycine max TaxID=3847 RepID=UPI001B3564E7|nr:galactose mutarotase-like [Glycine max]